MSELASEPAELNASRPAGVSELASEPAESGEPASELSESSELASEPRVLGLISDQPLSVPAMSDAVGAAMAGAVVVFTGVVRDHDGGRAVTALGYEAHPIAEQTLHAVAGEIAALPDVVGVAVAHRTGELRIGDLALVAAVSAPHRAEAFAACSELVERVKARVPIWKRQHFADGGEEWVGSPGQ